LAKGASSDERNRIRIARHPSKRAAGSI
jgi:hypothetical protein